MVEDDAYSRCLMDLVRASAGNTLRVSLQYMIRVRKNRKQESTIHNRGAARPEANAAPDTAIIVLGSFSLTPQIIESLFKNLLL